jgi:hypothetical protein
VTKEPKHSTAEEKLEIVRRHLFGNVPIPDLCRQLRLHYGLLRGWQMEFLMYGAAAFRQKDPKRLPD